MAVPDARRPLRGAAEARHRRGHARRSPRSTAGSTRTGVARTAIASSRRRTCRSATLEWAISELEWAIDRDARCIVMRPAAPHTADGQTPVSDPVFDPFWARVQEAGITVVVHAGDSGFSANGYAGDRFRGRVHERRPVGAERSSRSRSSAPRTTSSSRSRSTSSSTASPASGSRRSRTAPTSSATCSRSCARPTARCPATSPRTRSSRSGATSG